MVGLVQTVSSEWTPVVSHILSTKKAIRNLKNPSSFLVAFVMKIHFMLKQIFNKVLHDSTKQFCEN